MTTTKTCNQLVKKFIFSFLIGAAFLSQALCATAKEWTLAAEPFSFTQQDIDSSILLSESKALPSLILEQMHENMKRRPRSQELMERELYELKKQRLSLFLQLSKEVQTRDAIYLNNYSNRVLKLKIKAQDKKIAEIQKKISDNLVSVKNEKLKREKRKVIDDERRRKIEAGEIVINENNEVFSLEKFFRGFVKDEEITPIEKIVLYKNDFTALYDAGDEKRSEGYDSYVFTKGCVDSKINGLITGKITVFGSYISVNCEMYLYPGAIVGGRATEVGELSDLKTIASSIAQQLTPKIEETMPVQLSFQIEPEEARKNAIIAIDDIVHSYTEDKITVTGGVHTVSFSSKGYITESTSFAFEGNREFKISVKLDEDNPEKIKLALVKPYSGDIFTNGIFSGSVSEIQRFSEIKINNRNILGHFVAENGEACDFTINTRHAFDGNNLLLNAKPFNRSDYIENRRKWMYRSYSLLIVSLIPTFYSYGNFVAVNQGYSDRYGITLDDARSWQAIANVCTGISIGCGALFGIELVRYLNAANSVLPTQAKPMKQKKYKAISEKEEKARIKAEEKKAQEELEEKQKALEAESNKISDEKTGENHE